MTLIYCKSRLNCLFFQSLDRSIDIEVLHKSHSNQEDLSFSHFSVYKCFDSFASNLDPIYAKYLVYVSISSMGRPFGRTGVRQHILQTLQ